MIKKPTDGAQSRDAGKKKNAIARGVATANRAPMQRVSPQEYVRAVYLEMKRVTWPTRNEWVSATLLTIILVVGIGLFTFVCDWVFAWLFQAAHTL